MSKKEEQKFEEIFNEADTIAHAKTLLIFGNDVNKMPCGFAWVNVTPANSKFANWLKRTDKGTASVNTGVDISISKYNQSADHKAVHAVFMAQELQMAGFYATANSRLD